MRKFILMAGMSTLICITNVQAKIIKVTSAGPGNEVKSLKKERRAAARKEEALNKKIKLEKKQFRLEKKAKRLQKKEDKVDKRIK